MFPVKKGEWAEEDIITVMAHLDGLIKGAQEYAAGDGPPGFDKDQNNINHGEYLGNLKTALRLVRECLEGMPKC